MVTPIVNAQLDALNEIMKNVGTQLEIIAAKDRASVLTDAATLASLCSKGEILKFMNYGDQACFPWSDGETEYSPAFNLCHEGDAELEDGETIHGAFWEWDKTIPFSMPFDASEAIYAFDGTEGTGAKYIEIAKSYGTGWVAGDGIQITLETAPDAGDQLVISGLVGSSDANPTAGKTWNVYAKGDTTVKQTGTTASGKSGDKIGETSSEDVGKTNGKVCAPQRVCYGYGRWKESAMRQFLNSDAAAGSWWKAQNPFDRPPAEAATKNGLLYGYAEDVKRFFKPVKVVTVTCNADGNTDDITYDRVFLSSLEQMYCVPQFAGKEGEYWEYYKRLLGRPTPAPTSATYPRLIKYALNSPTSAQYCFRRSAHRFNAYYVWYVNSSGYVTANNARNAYRCAPGVFLSDD